MLKTATFLIDFEILWFEKVKLVCHRGFHKCVWSGFLHLVVSYYYSFLLFRREVSSRFVNIIFREEFQMCSLLLQIRVSLHNVHSWKKIRAFNVTKWVCDYGVSDCYFSHHTTRFNLNLRIETKKMYQMKGHFKRYLHVRPLFNCLSNLKKSLWTADEVGPIFCPFLQWGTVLKNYKNISRKKQKFFEVRRFHFTDVLKSIKKVFRNKVLI